MRECAQMAPLVRMHMLKKGDVQLLNAKFNELDQNGDRKIQWHEFEQGRSALPTSIQVPGERVQSLHLALQRLQTRLLSDRTLCAAPGVHTSFLFTVTAHARATTRAHRVRCRSFFWRGGRAT